MKKILICLYLVMNLMFCESIVFASVWHEVQYAQDDYSIPIESIHSLNNARLTENGIEVRAGGSLVYGLLPPFNMSAIKVNTLDGNKTLNVNVGDVSCTIESNTAYVFDSIVRKKDMEIVISSESGALITDVVLTRENEGFPPDRGITVAYGIDEELKLQTTTAMKIGSCAFLVNNAVRYVDYTDSQMVIELIDGKMYAPVSAMALALSLYSEEIPEKGYILLRRDNYMEFSCSFDGAYYQINDGVRVSIDNPVIYKNGTAYLPVRYIAELFGETVIYKDRIAVIDSKYSAKSIVENEALFEYIKNTLDGFEKSEQTGKTYYVAQTENANDKNEGSENAPFKTLKKAGEVVTAGDTVIVGDGIYRETLEVLNSGEKSRPITFKAKEGARPVISALDEVTGFELTNSTELASEANGHVLVANLEETLGEGRNMLFYNSEPVSEGRHPNDDTAPYASGRDALNLSCLWPTQGNLLLRLRTEQEISDNAKVFEVLSETDLAQPENYWAGGTFVGLVGSGWSVSTGKIESSQNGKIIIDNDKCGGTWFSNRNEEDDDFGYITNHIHTVDSPGEWYIDDANKQLYIYSPEGADAETLTVEVKARQLVADLEKNSYINLVGFETIGGGIRMNDGDMNVLNNCIFRYISHYTYTADQRDGYLEDINGRYNAADNDAYAPQRGEMGIYIGGEDTVIANCIIDHSAGAAIYSTGAYSLIINNEMTDCGYMGSVVGGIFLSGKAWKQKDEKRGGDVIYYNSVDKVGRSNILYENQHDEDCDPMTLCLPLDIGYNDLSNGMITARDGGLIYTHALSLGSDNLKSKVHHNMIRNTWSCQTWGKPGIYNDNTTIMQEIYDNLIFSENDIQMSETVFQHPKVEGGAYWGVVDTWNNNLFAGETGLLKSEINANDYPGGKPFRVGSSLTNGRYMENYNNRNSTFGWYDCRAVGELSDARIENGMVAFSKNGAYVKYENVDFGEKSNLLKICYSGDIYNTNDTIRVIIGESIDNGKEVTVNLATDSIYPEGNAYAQVPMGMVSGVQNVYIKAEDYHSITIRKIKPGYDAKAQAVRLYGGEHNNYLKLPSTDFASKTLITPFGDEHLAETQTRYGVTLVYENVEFPEDCTAVEWMAATAGEDSGSNVKVYVDENPYDTRPNNCKILTCWTTNRDKCSTHKHDIRTSASPYAEFTVTGDDWSNYKPGKKTTNKIIPAGRHTIYIRFESWHCSDLYYVGFSND